MLVENPRQCVFLNPVLDPHDVITARAPGIRPTAAKKLRDMGTTPKQDIARIIIRQTLRSVLYA